MKKVLHRGHAAKVVDGGAVDSGEVCKTGRAPELCITWCLHSAPPNVIKDLMVY